MRNLLFSGLSSLLLPMGAYAGPTAGASYQRTYLSASINASTADLSHASVLPRDLVDLSGDQLDIQVAHAVRELVIVDDGVAETDKAVLRRALKPGVEMVHISSAAAGLPQLIAALEGHKNLAAIHIISHAEAGAILLGNSRITAENIQREVQAFAALNGAVREGGDLLFYGCDLAANKAGEELLDIISNKTGLDVAASNNLTGNSELQGDWDLEVKRGNVEAALAFSEKSLKDFSNVLVASSGTKDFTSGWTDNNSSLTSTDFIVTGFDSGGSPISDLSFVIPGYANAAYLQTGYDSSTTGTYFQVAVDGTNTGSFELTGLIAGEAPALGGNFTNVHIVGIKPDNSTITSGELDGTGGTSDTFTFGAGQLTNFSGVQLKAFKLVFDTTSGSSTKPFFEFRSFSITGALAPSPTITSATYNTTSGALVVTGTNFTATGGATNDVDASDFTLTGEGGSTYTLTDTDDVEISSATSFTLTLSATDRAAANLIINKTGTSSTGATTYNLAGAAGFIAASGATADLTGNGITATVAAPTVTSATYDASTGALVVTGTNLKKLNGADNEIIANKFTLRGEGGTTYTLTDTANVEISSGTSFTLSLSATDKAGANLILNKNGTLSTDISTYNLAAAEDWNAGADAAVTIADTTGNGVTVSNVAVPTITSSTYDVSTGALVVTGTGLLKSQGATNDIVANKFTFTGQGAATYALTDTANVEVTSGTSFTLTLSATDRNAVGALLNKNGTSANDATTYNLAAAEDWNAGADSAVVTADLTGNGITTSNAFTAPNAPTIGTATAGDAQVSVTFTAPGSNGGSAITTYTATASPGGAFGTCAGPAACTATVTGLSNGTAYTFTVTATNAIGTSVASGASNSATPKGNQTITFANPGTQNFGTTPTLTATADSATGTDNLTVTFSSSTTGVCTITSGGALTFVTAGSCTIDADQAGDSATNSAPTVSRTFTVNAIVPDAPTIGTATAGDTQADVTFTAPVNTGGAAITGYTVTSNPGGFTGTGAGSPITVSSLTNGVSYTFTVTATNSAGTGAASGASNSITPASPQTITFANPGTQNFGTSPTLSATSTSSLTVSFTSSTTGVCTVSGTTLTFLSAGICTINADQAGDSSFLAASQVSQSFSVSPVVPGAPTIGTAIAGDTQASVAFVAPVNIGGSAITGYTVTVNPADVAPVMGASSPIVVTGLTNGQAYTFTVTADNVAGTGPASSASNSITPKSIQTVTFANPGPRNFGTTPTLIATTDATGLTPTFTSSTPGVCTITSGGTLTFVTVGTCTINADQAGDASYLAAPQVTNSFTVNAVVPGAPVIGSVTAGDTQASVSFSAPAFTGGAAVTGYTVTANPGGATATGAGSPITFTGLTNGTSYTFTVTATNSVGTGSASAASAAVTPNGPPSINGTPALTVNEDSAYSFVPSATDTMGDTLTFSIANKPAWAAFDTTTGALTGTPINADVGTTSAIVISVSDGSLSSSLAAFDLTVVNINDAPLISGTPTTSVDQDVAYSFTPTASDVDVGDVLTYSITNKPTWAAFDTATGALTGTPTNVDVGTTTGIVITVSDGTLSASLAAFDLTVTNVNEAPVISGTPTTSVDQDIAYSFTPTASDVDVGDVLTYSITNQPTWAAFDTATGALTGTPTNTDVGTTTGIVITVSDGTLSASLAAFDLTVTNVNEAPVISGTPLVSVDQDVAYSFIPTASDVDVGDVLTYSITNKPTWAAFDTATGALTGTPTNTDVGTTTGIVITVSDGTLSASLAAFDLTVTNVNEAPVISGTPLVSVDQDVAYSFTPTASDVDVGDVLTYSITNQPTWAAFDTATGALTGTPTNTDVGTTTGIVITVSDGTLSASLAAFDLTVTNVNEAPVISGTPLVSVDQDVAYSFTPTASDVDVGDVLTYSITNKPTWAAFDTATGALTGTPTNTDVGTTTGIVITVSDSVLSASLPAFNLEVIETIDPLQPVVTAPEDIAINATGLYTPVSLRQLLSLNASATQEQVDAILNSMASDGVSGNTCCTTNPEGLNVNNVLLLPPGRHEVSWSATNGADVTGTATQVVDIRPLVSLSKSQIAIRGSAVEFRVLLNGKAPEYPVAIPYVIDAATTAGTTEHNLVNGLANFTEAGQLEVIVPVQLATLSGLSDSELVVRLDGDINAGVANSHTIRIREGNIAPMVSLQLTQGGVNTIQITPAGGPVTLTATVTDLNPGDTHSYNWSASDTALGDTDGNPVNNTLVFDPSNLSGRHQAQVTVTDTGGATANVQLYFRVVPSLPVLVPDADTDGDGVTDTNEGFGDTNGNGIPDYLDNMPTSNILPQQGAITNAYLIECDPGVRCGLGQFALVGESGGVQILNEELGTTGELIIDPTFEPVGGIFDFVINDLPTLGQSVRIVIPQVAPIPANAVYRKYQDGRWVNFISNANNSIFSAPGNPGYCPPPGNPDWTPGLTAGNLCVQLTIEDGGPNDDDGLINAAIVDPGAVSVALPVEPPPPPPPAPDVNLKSKGGGAIDGLWLLLLGGVLMMKWITGTNRRGLIALALIATSASSQALTDGKAYVRVDVYKVEGDQREATFTQALSAAGHEFTVDKYDIDRRGYQIAFGYQWHDYTYSELGYLELGDVTVDMTLDGDTDLTAFKRDFANAYPVSASGWTAVQGLTLLRNQPVNISLEAGAYFWQDEKETNQQPITLQSDSGVAPLAGIRLDLGLTKNLSYGLSVRRIYLADQVVDMYSLSGRLRF
ncbi:DUF4347 domain-containing protein [Cellvibrio sp. KY-YJ-3]|uniref:DUF4347 domain-containing protein n=1 Tax=Cellvibrio sp. KY-YJ-3 TaxID=454662 RepID=UPI00124531B0|nr:DUF4347 domain-containing protein [Cellvibrio sp. KY-YJ-3]QEY12745.1 DUF4347 domain-containing protein [Cellvibrio sp. KY-YJ-3]